jgi:hypothetical protein
MGSVIGRWFSLSSVVRRLVVATMLLALFAAAAPALGPSASAQEDVAAAGPVTVQSWVCPLDYAGTDYLDDCTLGGPFGVRLTNPAGTTLTAETTNAGDVSFAGGAAGAYSLGTSLLGEGRASFYYACFDSADVFRFDGSGSVIDFSLAEGDSLFCRVYVTFLSFDEPAPASGEFRVYSCPVDYAGDSFLTACANAPSGDRFRVFADGGSYDVSVVTDANGVAAFSELPTGEISVSLDIETVDGATGVDFFCYNDLPGSESFLGQGNTPNVELSIDPGLFYFCEFYVTPLSSSVVPANATFQVFTCPVEYAGDDYLTDCAPVDPSAPVDILLSPGAELNLDLALTATTGAEGRTLFEALDPGTYSAAIDVSERVNTFYYACFVAEEFLFDGESVQFTADIAAGSLLSCRWYIIPFDLPGGESAAPSASASVSAPVPSASASAAASVTPSARPNASSRPAASAGPIATLPSTGTGAGDTSGWATLPLVALVVALAAATVTVARRLAIFR